MYYLDAGGSRLRDGLCFLQAPPVKALALRVCSTVCVRGLEDRHMCCACVIYIGVHGTCMVHVKNMHATAVFLRCCGGAYRVHVHRQDI
jgi:hypothetical protein